MNALLYHFGGKLSGDRGRKTARYRPTRIDKDTSGLLVVAKSDRAHHGLAAHSSQTTRVEREYRALCHGTNRTASDPRLRGIKRGQFRNGLASVKITTQLARHKTDRQRQAVLFTGGRHAVTRVRGVEEGASVPVSLVSIAGLETGRTHQIRVHLAHAGHALVGDQTYGGRRKVAPKVMGESLAAES